MIQDFLCMPGNAEEKLRELIREEQLPIPEIYTESREIMRFSLLEKEKNKKEYCTIPFDHTLEAQAMGGRIRYGNEIAGPRAEQYICQELEEILELPDIDFGKGRLNEVMKACRGLKKNGYEILFQISGPYTVLNTLIDLKKVLKGMRKQPDLILKIFEKLNSTLLCLIEEARQSGVELFSYADSAGGLNILGPRWLEWSTEQFTYKFLKEAARRMGQEALVILCPKTALALRGMGLARIEEEHVPKEVSYGKACILMKEKAQFIGQTCINQSRTVLKDGKIQILVLK